MVKFFFSHFWAAPVGFIFQTMVVIALIWFPKARHPDKEYSSTCIKAIRGFPMALFFFFGVIFIDIFVELVLLGSYGYETAAQFMPSAILAGIMGVQYVGMAMLVNPNVKTLATTSTYVVVYIVFMKAIVPASQDIWLILYGFVIMAAFGLVHASLFAGERIVKKIIPSFKGDKELWNVREPFKRVFNTRVNVALWAVVVTEALLQATGYSILTIFTAVI